MARKNLKVSEIVHEELALRKRKEESFDDVLKRELGLLPHGINDLVAFYPDRMATISREVVDLIEGRAKFEREITEYDEYYALEFDHPESQHTIVQVQFHEELENGVRAFYRDHHGELVELASVFIPEEYHEDLEEMGHPVYVGPLKEGHYDDWDTAVDPDAFAQQLEPKISGSHERWG